jgi:hypothetical protein
VNFYVGRSYDLIGLEFRRGRLRAVEKERLNWRALSFFFFFSFGDTSAVDESTRLGLRQFVEGGREAVERCKPGQRRAGQPAQSVRYCLFEDFLQISILGIGTNEIRAN